MFLGGIGRSHAILRVLRDGRVLDESPPRAGTAPRDLARVVRAVQTSQRWACWVPIPPSAVEDTERVFLGVEYFDARGVRSSWPRPSLPWQQEPGRLVIELGAWGGPK